MVKTQTVTAAGRPRLPGPLQRGRDAGLAGRLCRDGDDHQLAGQPLGAVVNETGPGGQFSSYDAVPAGSTTLNVPVALNNAFGGYYTGMGIQNTSASAGTVSVTYYDARRTPTVKNFIHRRQRLAGRLPGKRHRRTGGGRLHGDDHEHGGAGGDRQRGGAFEHQRQAVDFLQHVQRRQRDLHLPLVENAGTDRWNTGEGIMNTGTASDHGAGQLLRHRHRSSHRHSPDCRRWRRTPSGAFTSRPADCPAGSRATAVVTTSSGGQVAVICNESSGTTFMSYDGQ